MSIDKAVDAVKEVATNDKLQNAVAAMVNKSIAAFEAGADFLSEQIPDVLHQLLLWHAVHSAVLCLLGVGIAILWIVADVKLFKLTLAYEKTQTYDKGFAMVMGWGVFGCLPRVVLAIIASNLINLTWLQIWIAPKVWLIEYAAKLIK